MNIMASFLAPASENRPITVRDNRAVISRGEKADLRLDHPSVSRKHAIVTVMDDKSHFLLEDCGSSNGTYIEGVPVTQRSPLYADQCLEVGPFRFRLCRMPSGESERSQNDTPPQRPDGSETCSEEAIVRNAVQSLPQILHPQKQGRRVSGDEDLMAEAEKALYRHILESLPPSAEACRIESLTRRALTISLGLGPLEEWLHDPEVSEIMINGTRSVYLERGGTLEKVASPYHDEDAIRRLVDRILAPLGRRVDEKTPYVDGRLPDGSRLNVVIPPASLDGPVVTVRKFSGEWLSISHLVSRGSLSSEAASFLEAAVRKRRNILISGGTGTGKTTLLNALASFVGSGERVITIEDAAELDLQQEHVIRLETRPPNMEGQGEITTRSLVKNSLRMRPDRIIVGECRGEEAFDMLQAMNTGHEGSMTTCHANSPRDALKRVEMMALMSGLDVPQRIIREQISTAINIIIQISRQSEGRRLVTSIFEVDGFESDQILTQPIFEFCPTRSCLLSTGIGATFLRQQKPVDGA